VPVWAATLAWPFLEPTEEDCPPVSLETVFLWGMVFACGNVAALEKGRGMGGGIEVAAAAPGERMPRPLGVIWKFEPPGTPTPSGIVFSTPLMAEGRVFLAVHLGDPFSTIGRLYSLDAETGTELWRYELNNKKKGVFCSPTFADGKLFIGEGMHENSDCRMFCFDAATGNKLWDFSTGSHTESKPFVADGKVWFGAGNDGVYCLDANDGKKIWNYPGLHVDGNPVVHEGRLYVGSGISRTYNTTAMICLDASDGRPIWSTPSEYSCFAAPVVAGQHVYFGLGNGNFSASDSSPKGALLCLDTATGKRLWQCDAGDAVLCKPACDLENVYFTSRDGNIYCSNRADGRVRWKKSLGAPIVASPCLISDEAEFGTVRSVYVAAADGKVACLDADNGRIFWKLDLARQARLPEALIYASPVVVARREGGVERRRIFIAGAVGNDVTALSSSLPRLFCLEDEVK
jgi:outer membrane protein assembly factor BamB